MMAEGYKTFEVVEDSILSAKTVLGKTSSGAVTFLGSLPKQVSLRYVEIGTGAITELNAWKARAIASGDYTFTFTILNQTWINADFRVTGISGIILSAGTDDAAGAEHLSFTVNLVEVVN